MPLKKQNAYTIADDIFMDALEIISANFNDIPYAIVGGGAVQVYIAAAAMKQSGLNSVNEINGLTLILRRTGDVNLSFEADMSEMTRRWNLIVSQSQGGYVCRSFPKRFALQDGSRRFNLNYQTEPEDLKGISAYYHDIIHSAVHVALPSGGRTLQLKIARPEYLVASKLTRIKPKDQVDISLLLKAADMEGYPFDAEEVRSILKSVGKGEGYDILAELMEG